METEQSIICKIGGHVNSRPEIIVSYPLLTILPEQENELLSKCLPIGSKIGDIIVNKYKKNTVISYIFKVEKKESRDDLFSISVLLNKKSNSEIYEEILKDFIDTLEKNSLLTENNLINYQKSIYEGFTEEAEITIDNLTINFSEIFNEIKTKLIKQKPNLKGSFF